MQNRRMLTTRFLGALFRLNEVSSGNDNCAFAITLGDSVKLSHVAMRSEVSSRIHASVTT